MTNITILTLLAFLGTMGMVSTTCHNLTEGQCIKPSSKKYCIAQNELLVSRAKENDDLKLTMTENDEG